MATVLYFATNAIYNDDTKPRMSTPFGTQLSPARLQFKLRIQAQKKCVRCELPYKEIENLGTWHCVAYHPRIVANADGIYECCGNKRGAMGCVKADHTTGRFNVMATDKSQLEEEITTDECLFMASLLNIPLDALKTPAWRCDERAASYFVCRVDYAARSIAMHHQYKMK